MGAAPAGADSAVYPRKTSASRRPGDAASARLPAGAGLQLRPVHLAGRHQRSDHLCLRFLRRRRAAAGFIRAENRCFPCPRRRKRRSAAALSRHPAKRPAFQSALRETRSGIILHAVRVHPHSGSGRADEGLCARRNARRGRRHAPLFERLHGTARV